jgi:phosphoribosylformylglycinamidine (FGAM) synthase-like enzyme
VSGNVSFYNETSGRAIYPTPTIAMVGLLENWERHAVSHFQRAGLAIVLLGESREELGGSEWLAQRRGLEAGLPPVVDLGGEKRLHGVLAAGVARALIRSAHDVSDGGLAVALAECAFAGPQLVGATVRLAGTIRPDALLFGESTGRVVATSSDAEALVELARQSGLPAERIGETGGERLSVGPTSGEPWLDAEVASLRDRWRDAIPRRLGEA